jgi:hypothetical protein
VCGRWLKARTQPPSENCFRERGGAEGTRDSRHEVAGEREIGRPATAGERGALRFVAGGRTYWLLLLKPAHVPLGGWCRVTVIQGGEFADTSSTNSGVGKVGQMISRMRDWGGGGACCGSPPAFHHPIQNPRASGRSPEEAARTKKDRGGLACQTRLRSWGPQI